MLIVLKKKGKAFYMKRLTSFLCATVMLSSLLTSCSLFGSSKDNKSGSDADAELTEFCFTKKSGFYDKAFTLEIFHPDSNAKIYYTTDGSTPDESDTLYEGGIKLENASDKPNDLSAQTGISGSGDFIPSEKVDKANVIRAVAVLDDGTKSEIINGTFFVGIDREKKYGDAPVLSLLTDKENLFDYEKGIYILGKTYDDWVSEKSSNRWVQGWQKKGNYSNRGREWERPVNVEYITSDGSEGFCLDMGIRIMGGASRNSCQKSFRLTARDEYGQKNIKYPLIPGNEKSDGNGEVVKYKSFVLRNGGNDYDYAKIRDPLLQQLVNDRRMETTQFTPAVVFIDGEYWGSYMLNEDYNDNYIQNNYDGIDNENVVIMKNGDIEEGTDEDKLLFDMMYNYIIKNDMSDAEKYARACEMLDMGSFMDYIAFNLFIGNNDGFFHSNNWQMWRVRNADGLSDMSDGKWRMIAHDTDSSTGIYNDGTAFTQNHISEAISKGKSSNYPAKLFTSLLENDGFKTDFIRTMSDIRNVNFEPDRVTEQIDALSELYKIHAVNTYERFGPEWIMGNDIENYYETEVSQLEKFLHGRYDNFSKLMKVAFLSKDISNVSIKSENPEKGAVRVNSSTLELPEDFVGEYFDKYGLSVTAVEKDGAKFVKWECEGCEVSDPTAITTEVTLSGDCTITAVFE